MSDPIGGLGQASAKMVEEIQKQAQQQVQKQTDGVQKFNEVLSAQQANATNPTQGVNAAQAVNQSQQIDPTQKAISTLQAAKLNASDMTVTDKAVTGVDQAANKGFKKLIGGIVDGQGKLDKIIKLATSGKKFDHQQLLAIQASVYKYSQELELTSKVVEKATSGVKQTMQTQV